MDKRAGSAGLRRVLFFLAVLLSCGWFSTELVAQSKVNLEAVIKDIMKVSLETEHHTLIMWFPPEFFAAAGEASGKKDAETEKFMRLLQPYMIFAVAHGKPGPFGNTKYEEEASLRKLIRLTDSAGARYTPLSGEAINADLRTLVSILKIFVEQGQGEQGKNMHFFVFPGKDKTGGEIANAKKEGTFSLELGEREFKWRLPLGSLLPPKTCPVDGEKVNGAWKFCPWHGSKLQ